MAKGKKTRRGKKKPVWDEKPTFGAFYLHEVLHMSEYFSRAVDTELGEHPAVKNNPEFLALVEAASGALGELYQKIGTAVARARDAMEAEERRMRDQS